ncbi:H-NS family nucleoid-associated regulatory protein [Arenibacterium sp. LLYu02]|uniref:H-NS histone family protein n=1 Tax=Arenibacterium sp. LLYu02 TaxID=3404132 RepID=UPI003B212264
MSLDLTEMSRKDLLQLQKDVEKALKDAEQRERSEALKAVEKAAAEYGFSLDEVLSAPAKVVVRKTKAVAKYRNPENHDETWSGRGRKPHWVHTAISNGVDISDLEI